MAKKTININQPQDFINVGSAPNSKDGDSLRAAFARLNDAVDNIDSNFSELYTAVGQPVDGNLKTDIVGSVFGDDSSLLVDGVMNRIVGPVYNAVGNIKITGGTVGQVLRTDGSGNLSWVTTSQFSGSYNDLTNKPTIPSGDRLINATDKIVLNEEGATRLSMYLNNVEKSRIQINTNDLLLSSLAGGVVLAATDGVGGEWRFKTNGNLESTGGNFLSAAETPAVFGSLNSTSTGASSGTVTLKSGTGNVDGGSIYIEAGTGGSGNDGEVVIKTGSTPYEWLFDNGGILTVPGRITLGTDAFITGYGDFAGLYPSSTSGSAGLELDAVNDALLVGTRDVIIRANGAGPWKSWTFKSTGDLQLPGNLQSNGNINIEINLADSTKRIWQFGEDGNFVIPGELNVPQKINIGSGGFLEYSSGNFFVDGSNIIIGNSGGMSYWGFNSSTGNITFPDATVQSTAALTYTNFGDSGVRTDGGTGNNFWKPTFADGTGTINKAGVYKTANNANNSLFTFGANGAGTMSVVMDGSLFVGSSLPSNNGGLNTNYGGWLVVQAGAKFGGDLNTIGNFILDTPGNYVRFGDGTTQTTAADFGYLDLDKDTIKGTAGYQYTFATDGYFTSSTSSESTNYFFVVYNTTNANIAAGWTVVGGTANTTVSSVTYPVAGYPGVIRVNLTVAASSTSGFYPVTVTSPDRLRVEIQPNPGTNDKFAFTTSGLTFPDATVQTTAFTGNAATIDIMNTNGIDTDYSITFVENRDGAEILRADVDLTFNSWSNTLTAGNVAVKQTLTGGIIANGSDFIITSQPNPDRNNACNIGILPGDATGTASEAGFVSIQGGSSDVVGLAAGDVYLRGGSHTNGGVSGTIKVQSILKIDDGVHEKFQTKSNATGTVTHDCSSGHIFYHTLPSANWTVNLTNLNLAVGYATTVTLVIEQGATGRYPSAVQVDGNAVPLAWQGNTTPTPSSNRFDVVTFSILYDGLYTVLGQLTGF